MIRIVDLIKYEYDEGAKDWCMETMKHNPHCISEGRWFGYTACYGRSSCTFLPTMLDTERCTRKVTVRADGEDNYSINVYLPVFTFKMAGDYYSGTLLLEDELEYQKQILEDVENYWNSEILSILPVWKIIKIKS